MIKNYLKILLFVLPLFLLQTVLSQNASLVSFRFSVEPDKTRLVFGASAPINYNVVNFPEKIIIDIKNTKLNCQIKSKWGDRTPIENFSSIRNKNDLRLVIRLKKQVQVKHFTLNKPNRLVLDLISLDKIKEVAKKGSSNDKDLFEELMGGLAGVKFTESKAVIKSSDADKDKGKDNSDHSIQVRKGGVKNLRKIVVVIDPGHGGRDPGAIGIKGTREKNITLAVAKHLHYKINKIKGFKAFLTRKDDNFMSLRQRLNVAHKHNADLFISIHADAYMHNRAHGASIFALSQRGATSEAARWLAKKENESELGSALSNKNVMLRSVLIDLAQTATIGSSLEVGGIMLRNLSRVAKLHTKHIEQAAFVVLKSPEIPSLLVELGFLTNKLEERKLSNSKYQKKLADNLAAGIGSYFMHRAPHGTYLAKLKIK